VRDLRPVDRQHEGPPTQAWKEPPDAGGHQHRSRADGAVADSRAEMARGPLGARHESVASLSRASLERAVPAGDAVLLDTSTLVAYFGDGPTTAAAATIVDEFVRPGRNRAVVSAISATELLI